MSASPSSDPAPGRAELDEAMRQITELSKTRFALPGGFGDGVLRDQIEELEAKANRLSTGLGEPEPFPQQKHANTWPGWLGWAIVGAVMIATLVVVWAMS